MAMDDDLSDIVVPEGWDETDYTPKFEALKSEMLGKLAAKGKELMAEVDKELAESEAAIKAAEAAVQPFEEIPDPEWITI
mmetsp:Transcript_22872/g.33905  ORF Transcript_22872/g.33905 Transcript_22872/m.33905 type:complete len:80 (+) Transcript_22872:483-722(+)